MFCNSMTRSTTTRLGFVLLLKTYQRLGYFVSSKQVPNAIIEYVAAAIDESYDKLYPLRSLGSRVYLGRPHQKQVGYPARHGAWRYLGAKAHQFMDWLFCWALS